MWQWKQQQVPVPTFNPLTAESGKADEVGRPKAPTH